MRLSLFSPPLGRPTFSLVRAVLAAAWCLLLAGSAPSVQAQNPEIGTVLPAHFQAHRIYVTPVTAAGDTLRLYTDTGGGRYPILTKPAVERLGLSPTDTLTQGRRSIPMVPFPDVPEMPAPDRALVFSNRGQARILDVGDGMLGQGWFAGGLWTFDYGAERLVHHPSREGLSFDPRHTIDLAFQTDSTGRRTGHHPRMAATIAGERHSFLLDTGATSVLADSARGVVGGAKRMGTSFVTASLFERWQREHPEWTVVEGASVYRGGTPLIRVPEVTVAGHTVGPVWFERRPDRAFKTGMARSMDQPVEGALGGSLFRYFRVTVDYPEARAQFERLAD